MHTIHIGRETWRQVSAAIDHESDWSLGQILARLEVELDACKDTRFARELMMAMQLVEEELDLRELLRA